MKKRLIALALLLILGAPVGANPIVTLGPPVAGDFVTVQPGSIRVEMLGPGEFIDLQLAVTVHPFCIRPIDIGLSTTGDGGSFLNLTGIVVNGCGGDTSEFDFRLTGDGLARTFDIEIIDTDSGGLLFAIPVELFPGVADTDNDGISDLFDNCLLVANANQRDTNGDRIGNLCDPDVAAPNDCIVNFLDLNVYRINFFRVGDLDTDNNGDGQTNFVDLEIVRSFFFLPPGPSVDGCN